MNSPAGRPTSVTVIGWAWIIIGAYAVLASVGNLVVLWVKPEMYRQLRVLPALAVFQLGLGALGVFAGLRFLQLRNWARAVLETLSWILLIYLAGFGLVAFRMLSAMVPPGDPGKVEAFAKVIAAAVICAFGVPLAMMLKSLRGEKVRSAMTS